MSQTEMKVLREALQRIHRVAIGESTEAYMRIPADPSRDADLLLAGALDELERLRAELEQVKRERDAPPREDINASFEHDSDTTSLSALRRWVKAFDTRGEVLDTVMRATSEGGSQFDFDPQSVVALMDELDAARADNARLREALQTLTLWFSRNRQHMSLTNDGSINALAEWDSIEVAHNNGCVTLAATDSREWLREFGMKVAEAVDVDHKGQRRQSDSWLAAIVAGVLK